MEDSFGKRVTTVYDSFGRVSATVDQFGITTTVYDDFGRVSATVDRLGNRTTSVYDVRGRREAVVNALGERTTTTFDEFGRVSETRIADDRRVTYHLALPVTARHVELSGLPPGTYAGNSDSRVRW